MMKKEKNLLLAAVALTVCGICVNQEEIAIADSAGSSIMKEIEIAELQYMAEPVFVSNPTAVAAQIDSEVVKEIEQEEDAEDDVIEVKQEEDAEDNVTVIEATNPKNPSSNTGKSPVEAPGSPNEPEGPTTPGNNDGSHPLTGSFDVSHPDVKFDRYGIGHSNVDPNAKYWATSSGKVYEITDPNFRMEEIMQSPSWHTYMRYVGDTSQMQ